MSTAEQRPVRSSLPAALPDGEPTAATRRRSRGYVRSYGPSRQCRVADCSTVLSRYNAATACWFHDHTDAE